MTKTMRIEERYTNPELGVAHYRATETLTETDDGLRVEVASTNVITGKSSRTTKVYPGVTLEAAVAWRMAHGYSEVK